MPFGQHGKGLADHPAVHLRHQAITLGGGNEGIGRHQAAVFAPQAQEDFIKGAFLAGHDRFDALAMQQEAILLQGLGDARDPVHLALAPVQFGIVRLVDVDTVAATVLGGVTGHVRMPQHPAQVTAVLVDGDHPDAGADIEGLALPGKPVVPEGQPDLAGDLDGMLQRTPLQQQAEFITAQARHGIGIAHLSFQQWRDLPEQFIAGGMAAGIVDHLELVQVDIEQGVPLVFVHRRFEQAVQAVFELAAVGQAGEGVVGGLPGQLAGHLPGRGDVMKHQHHANDPALAVTDRRGRVIDADLPAIARDQHGMVGQADHRVVAQADIDRIDGLLAGVFIDDAEHLVQGLSPGLLRRPAGQYLGHRVEIVDDAGGIGGDHRVADGMQGHFGAFLLGMQDGLLGDQFRHLFLVGPGGLYQQLAQQGVFRLQGKTHAGFSLSPTRMPV